ncbi:glycoside hydrolase family 5 protein [Gynuella sunshinyii]|uniref:Endoglucanase n=1 Tax=Gynuella sunshinyii YC6258 TaxID=1445510 RepID=A0A0C5VMR6_9GAMM|nr:glycoside hydrolase family 5 protein [Gynuella sunshinyii]AJQ96022.1 endoglucanase [Gynuella sunshinyii YC6258]
MQLPISLKLKHLQICLLTTLPLLSLPSHAGFSVSGTQLLDGNDKPFVMRGINYPHSWYSTNTTQAIKDMASVSANTVRVVLSSGYRWNRSSAEEVTSIIEQLKAQKMIAVLEVHDTTGYGEDSAASSLSSATDYWLDIAAALKGQEDYVIINIGNEPIGNNVDSSVWIDGHKDAIKRLREAGLTHTLLIDAPAWGQDWQHVMLDNAKTVAAADSLNNTMFSVHMYQVYGDYNSVYQYVSKFLNNNQLPLIVGEFGADHQGENVDEDSIMALAEQYGIGYLGWSWSGNSGGTESLDITENFNVTNLTTWGDRLINGVNGLKSTSVAATVYDDASSDNNDSGDTGTDDSGSDGSGSDNTDDNGSDNTDNNGSDNGSSDDNNNTNGSSNEGQNDVISIHAGSLMPSLMAMFIWPLIALRRKAGRK